MSTERVPADSRGLVSLLRELTTHLSPRRRKQAMGLLALMLAAAVAELFTLGAVLPFIALMAQPETAMNYPYLQSFFGALGWQDPNDLVRPMAVAFVLLIVLAAAIRLLLAWVNTRFIYALGYDIGVNLYSRVLHQGYSYHVAHNSSEMLAAVGKVQITVSNLFLPLIQGISAVFISAGILIGLLFIDTYTALIAGASFTVIYVIVSLTVRARLRANGVVIARTQTTRLRHINEGMGSIRDVILDGSQSFYVRQFAAADHAMRRAQASNEFTAIAPRYLIESVGMTLIIAIAWVLSRQPGGLMAALPILGALALGAQKLLPLLQQLYQAWSKAAGNRHVFADVLDLLALSQEQTQASASEARLAIPFMQNIQLKDLGFSYPGSGPILDGVRLEIPQGARVGIVGKTGSGKSTLVDLLMGLLIPTSGCILVDGQEITSANRALWRRRIAHVPQSIYLSDGTIAENIAIGQAAQNIDLERVRDAAARAQIADFIESNPLAYTANVGERGIKLSGGQRQRIGIARALYKQADVLVFDEATSALDSETESEVMGCIQQLGDELTIFIIAHRVQTLEHCDMIIKLNHSGLQVQQRRGADASRKGFEKTAMHGERSAC